MIKSVVNFVVMAMLVSVVFFNVPVLACDGRHCKMLEREILDIFRNHPGRFDSTEKNFMELDSLKKREVYFSIEDDRLVPGFFCELSDGSVAYWTEAGDTLSEVIFRFQGYCSPDDIKKVAGENGISPGRLTEDDILIFEQEEDN